MTRRRIPVTAETVSDCNMCDPSACCMGNMLLQLTDEEAELMTRTGNTLFRQVPSAPYFRREAPYATGYTIRVDGTVAFHLDEDKPTEPLEAGLGRYILAGACANLVTDLLGRTSCAIYDERPEACATFEAGSEECHQMQHRVRLGLV